MRRTLSTITVLSTVAITLVASAGAPGAATAVATDPATYAQYGRVFPDPLACLRGDPGSSPWAKGDVCATGWLGWDETIAGLRFLESQHPRYLDVLNLREQLSHLPALLGEDLQSAGFLRENLERVRSDLHVVKVTDEASAIPEADREHFLVFLSLHGEEPFGREAGVRIVEDLVTWSACEDGGSAPACGTDGPFPKPILEPSGSGPTAGAVLDRSVVYLVLGNPDGWRQGELESGGIRRSRFNGNGVDLNRDWAALGYTEARYTPFSEPESRGFGRFLAHVKDTTSAGRFAATADLHNFGWDDQHFGLTLLDVEGDVDYAENATAVEFGVRTYRDAVERLKWSKNIAPPGDCPTTGHEEVLLVQVCPDAWGTAWETIAYTVTGAAVTWTSAPHGLGDRLDVTKELALALEQGAHLFSPLVYDPHFVQLGIDSNKGTVYLQLAQILQGTEASFAPGGRIGYLEDGQRTAHPGGSLASPLSGLPTQAGIDRIVLPDEVFEFDILGPDAGVHNGSVTVVAAYANVRTLSGQAVAGDLVLERCGLTDCEEVGRDTHPDLPSFYYLPPSGRIDVNEPDPGRYRLHHTSPVDEPVRYTISFGSGPSTGVPDQAPYDVSRTDFFVDLNDHVAEGSPPLEPITVEEILRGRRALDRFDTLVVTGELVPSDLDEKKQGTVLGRMRAWVAAGGNLVLTDEALTGLARLDVGLNEHDIVRGFFYAGWMDFSDGTSDTYRDPLADAVDKDGHVDLPFTFSGQVFQEPQQTYEPGPLGFVVSPLRFENFECLKDVCDAPNWVVSPAAWQAAGGRAAARTFVHLDIDARDGVEQTVGVSLGELPVGDGVVRIAGALLPEPTEANYHPFGLASHAVTPTGYQLFENLVTWSNPARTDGGMQGKGLR
ncbi:MAG: hypothetical protein KY469_20870 [Actinobacteria bacterium]|nr:hypothetical protein [Actinomycetota bacterium]